MKKLIPLAIAALAALPISAQVGGSVNVGAPKVMSGIQMGDAKMSVEYTAIRFADGQWQKTKDNKARYEAFNRRAEASPMGTVKTTAPMSCSGRNIAAGEYKLFFSLHDQYGWMVNLKNEDNAYMWRLDTKETDEKRERMHIALTPGKANDMAHFTMAFGNQTMTVNVTPAKGEEDGDK